MKRFCQLFFKLLEVLFCTSNFLIELFAHINVFKGNTMYKLDEIKEFLKEFTITDKRIEKLYEMISNPQNRVNSDDKQWVATTSESERTTVYSAIETILDDSKISYLSSSVVAAFKVVSEDLERLNKKPRIPFYILMLDQLVA